MVGKGKTQKLGNNKKWSHVPGIFCFMNLRNKTFGHFIFEWSVNSSQYLCVLQLVHTSRPVPHRQLLTASHTDQRAIR
jgi:hypothetical protein